MANKSKTNARILVELTHQGKTYKPNQVVSFDSNTAKGLEKEGQVDTSAAAVSYCQSEGAEVIEHEGPADEAAALDAA
jgi:hypothetical protein